MLSVLRRVLQSPRRIASLAIPAFTCSWCRAFVATAAACGKGKGFVMRKEEGFQSLDCCQPQFHNFYVEKEKKRDN